jgi:L-lactate dehydrogenase complex protein LldF
MSKGMSLLFNHPMLYSGVLRLSPVVNWLPGPVVACSLNPWAYGHQMMKFPDKSFHQLWKERLL